MGDMVGAHNELHSEQGAFRGEHPGRSRNPVIKVADLAWLEFDKPDLSRAAAFARAFGFQTTAAGPDELHLRGTDAGGPSVIIRRGPATRFRGFAFRADDEADLLRLADKTGVTPSRLPERIGGQAVNLVDPSGKAVKVVAGLNQSPALPSQAPHVFNIGHQEPHNTTQRPPRVARARPASGSCRPVIDQVHRVPQLASRPLRPDRQRLPLLPRTRDTWADDQLHPLRSRRDPDRPPHHGDGARPGEPLRPLAPTRSAISTPSPPAANTCASRATSGPGASAGTFRAVSSSTTGATPTVSWSSTSPTATCSTTPSRRGWAPFAASGLAQWGPPASKDFLGIDAEHARDEVARDRHGPAGEQRIRPQTVDRIAESSALMTISVLRTADGWWVQTGTGAARVETSAATTGELLGDRSAVQAAQLSGTTVPVDSLTLLSPVTKPCRVVAQMTNFASHVRDAEWTPTASPYERWSCPKVARYHQSTQRQGSDCRERMRPRKRREHLEQCRCAPNGTRHPRFRFCSRGRIQRGWTHPERRWRGGFRSPAMSQTRFQGPTSANCGSARHRREACSHRGQREDFGGACRDLEGGVFGGIRLPELHIPIEESLGNCFQVRAEEDRRRGSLVWPLPPASGSWICRSGSRVSTLIKLTVFWGPLPGKDDCPLKSPAVANFRPAHPPSLRR